MREAFEPCGFFALDDDPDRHRYLLDAAYPGGGRPDVAIAATHDLATGETTDFRIVPHPTGADGITRPDVLE